MKEKLVTISIFFVVLASSLYFGIPRLANFSGVDEPYWSYDRVPRFWKSVGEMNWKQTNLCDKPGITLAMVSGAGLPFIGENPKDYQYLRYEPKTPEQLQKIEDIYFYLRLPVFLFTLAMLPVFYFLIKKLLGKNSARFSLIFIGLSPILLGISLIVNSDAMLWILTALSSLSLFLFLKNSERKYLILSGFLLGLSVITKYVANILFVYFFLIFFLEYIFLAHRNMAVGAYLKKALANYAILFATAMATAFVFFPATWIDISKLIKATVGNDVFSSTWPIFTAIVGLLLADLFAFKARFSIRIFGFLKQKRLILARAVMILFLFLCVFVFLHVYGFLNIFDLESIIASPKGIGEKSVLENYAGAVSADVYSLLFSISPLVLISLLFAAGNILMKKELERDSVTAVYILIFIFIFYLGSAVNSVVTTVRYQIVVYPLIFILAAIGISQFFSLKKISESVPLWLGYSAAAVVLIASLAYVRPHFLAYASELLPENFIVNLKGMGEGSVEAARWLNDQPGAGEMTIWSDKGAVCERFVGKCLIDFKKETFKEEKFDYLVVSTDRRSRTFKLSKSVKNHIDFEKVYPSEKSVFRIIIDNNPNDFVKILRASDFINEP